MEPIRINKYLAEQGVASRREADRLIEAGKILINGKVAKLGDKVGANDRIEVDAESQKLRAKSHLYYAYNKARGVATEDVKYPNQTFPLGRLDKDSEGLLLITNDGRLTERLLGPEANQEKEYVVEVDKKVDGLDLKRMNGGLDIEGEKTKPAKTSKINDTVFKIILIEGKKHQIRRMCAALGYQVQSLKRIRVANIHLGKERPGTFRALSEREQKQLLELLNLKN